MRKNRYYRGIVIRPDDRIPEPITLGRIGEPMDWSVWERECLSFLGYIVKPPNRYGQQAAQMSRQELVRMGFLFAAGVASMKETL